MVGGCQPLIPNPTPSNPVSATLKVGSRMSRTWHFAGQVLTLIPIGRVPGDHRAPRDLQGCGGGFLSPIPRSRPLPLSSRAACSSAQHQPNPTPSLPLLPFPAPSQHIPNSQGSPLSHICHHRSPSKAMAPKCKYNPVISCLRTLLASLTSESPQQHTPFMV